MLLFGHVGITLAATRVVEKTLASLGAKKVSDLIDYRLLLVGSMLPDIIDKPLGGLVFKETIGNGRIYAHTFLFLLLLFVPGLLLWFAKRRSDVLVLAWGSFLHDVLDAMWLDLETFLWPLYGWSFLRGHPENWIFLWLKGLLTDASVFVPEAAGLFFLILAARAALLSRR